MGRYAAAYDWLTRMEKHPTPVRIGNAIFWRWRWEQDGPEIDTLPTAVAKHLPRGDSPRGNAYSTRKRAHAAAANAVNAAVKAGWEPTRIIDTP